MVSMLIAKEVNWPLAAAFLALAFAGICSTAHCADRAGSATGGVFRVVDISKVCNRDFWGDVKGGWTEQGTNDLRNIDLGLHTFADVPFEIIDPAKNGGKACVMLRPGSSDKARIEVEKQASSLYFLHTSAWNPGGAIGSYVIHLSPYPKDVREKYESEMAIGRRVREPLEVSVTVPLDSSNMADWWNPVALKEAGLGWTGQTVGGQKVGTYVYQWENSFTGYWVSSIDFVKQGNLSAAPVLLAITAMESTGDVKVKGSPEVYTRLSQIKENLKDLQSRLEEHSRASKGYYAEVNECVVPELKEIMVEHKWEADFAALTQRVTAFQKTLSERENRFVDGDKVTFQDEKIALDELLRDADLFTASRGINDTHAQKAGAKCLIGFTNKTIAEVKGLKPTQSYYSGRRSLYLLGISREYVDAVSARLKSGECHANYLLYLARGIKCAQEALKLAKDPKSRISTASRTVVGLGDHPAFSPQQEICINGKWQCRFNDGPDEVPGGSWLKINVPHHTLPASFRTLYGLPKESVEKPITSMWYKTDVRVPSDYKSRVIKIKIESAAHYTEVFFNGVFCGKHLGSFAPFEVDVTHAAKPGKSNTLAVYLERETYSAVPGNPVQNFCSVYPYNVIGKAYNIGIHGDVFLKSYPVVCVQKNLIDTLVGKSEIRLRTYVSNFGTTARRVDLTNVVRDKNGKKVLTIGSRTVSVPAGGTVLVEMKRKCPGFKPWGIGGEYGSADNLYFLESRVSEGSKTVDIAHERFGFREFKISGDKFTLNGEEIFLQDGGAQWAQYNPPAAMARPYQFRFLNTYRRANCNINRNFCPSYSSYFDVSDEMGMLCENQFIVDGWPDSYVERLPGEDSNDPVWVKNMEQDYKQWIEKDYNHPSVVLWSSNNEAFASDNPKSRAAFARFVAFQKYIKQIDSQGRPVDSHGNQGLASEQGFEVVNLHYPPLEQLNDWRQKYGGRPVIMGEFYAGEALRCQMTRDPDPAVAAVGEDAITNHCIKCIKHAREQDLPGIMVHNLIAMGFFCTASVDKMGPWGNVFKQPLSQYTDYWWDELVPVQYPAESGLGYRQPFIGARWNGSINWFDPTRVESTPNKLFDAIKDNFRPMPALKSTLPPEVVVEVPKAPGVNVFATPLDGQPIAPCGVKADDEGRAWLMLKLPGRYRISASVNGRTLTADINTSEWNTNVPPGYSYVQKMVLK